MTAIRTLVVTMSPLLAGLVTDQLRPHLTLDVIGLLSTRVHLEQHLREAAPDLVLLGLKGTETDECARSLLAVLPSVKILALTPNGQHAWLHELRPHREAMIDFSAQTLIRTLGSLYGYNSAKG